MIMQYRCLPRPVPRHDGEEYHRITTPPESSEYNISADLIPTFAVTIDDADVDADNWETTPAEQQEGQIVTLTYKGKKKVKSITIEKAPAEPAELVDTMSPMLTISVKTEGLGDDGLGFDDQGGNQGEAWTKGNNGSDTWDFEW